MKTESLYYCEECETEFWIETNCWGHYSTRCPDCLSYECKPVYVTKGMRKRLGI